MKTIDVVIRSCVLDGVSAYHPVYSLHVVAYIFICFGLDMRGDNVRLDTLTIRVTVHMSCVLELHYVLAVLCRLSFHP